MEEAKKGVSLTYAYTQDGSGESVMSPEIELLPTVTKPKCKPIFLCTMGSKGYLHYAVVPIPESYYAAKELAIDVLGGYLGYHNVTPDDIYLKYGIKRPTGTFWAYLKPSFWQEILNGGEEIRVFKKRAGQELEDDHEEQKPTTVVFRFGEEEMFSRLAKRVITVIPETRDDAKAVVIKTLGHCMRAKDPEPKNILLRAVVKNTEGEWVLAVIPQDGWKQVVTSLKRTNQNLEIAVIEIVDRKRLK